VTQAFLKATQESFLVADLDIDHAVGMQPSLRERRREEVAPSNAPENLAGKTGEDAGRKEGGRGTMDRAIAAPGHFMKGGKRKAAARQYPVDHTDSKRQKPALGLAIRLDAANARAQFLYGDGASQPWTPQ